ncbi:MAG: M20/M25/M40 family metallo-hydrolase [Sandaracinaceae bacterium]
MRALVLLLCLGLSACGASSSPDASPPPDAPDDATGTDSGREPLPPCSEDSSLARAACVEEARYRADLEAIAEERVPETAHWMAVQDLCASRLEALGFTVERQDYGTGVNVVGVLEGTSEPARRVVIGAHYDHIAGCEGADDNASGVAGVLEAARVLASPHPRTLVAACWDEEERGLIGSRAWVAQETTAGRGVDVYFNFEMIGYYDDTPNTQRLPPGFELLFPRPVARIERNETRGDFIALIGDASAEPWLDALEAASERAGLSAIPLSVSATLKNDPLLADLQRSDHAPFWAADFPAIMLTDTANFRYDAYHCPGGAEDSVSRLDVTRASQVTAITVAAASLALGDE